MNKDVPRVTAFMYRPLVPVGFNPDSGGPWSEACGTRR
jgi:hypothetical protein